MDAVIDAKGLKQMNDTGALEAIIDEVMAANPANVEQYRAGKDKAFNALVGQVMKASKGKANPAQVECAAESQTRRLAVWGGAPVGRCACQIPRHPLGKLGHGQWAAEVVALPGGAAVVLQKVALGGGFYPFGNHAQAQAGAQGHHGRAIAASFASVRTSRTKPWSIFSWSSGKRFK